jgi:hypothetical protein
VRRCHLHGDELVGGKCPTCVAWDGDSLPKPRPFRPPAIRPHVARVKAAPRVRRCAVRRPKPSRAMPEQCPVHEQNRTRWGAALVCKACTPISQRMSDMGKLGGPARAKALSKERLREISRMGNEARWGKRT